MKSYLSIALLSVIIVAFVLFILDNLYLNSDARVGVGILTITGWMSLILFSAYNSNELRQSH